MKLKNPFKKIIYREDGVTPYLIRYRIFGIPGIFSIKVHHILLSDYDCLHDHPWSFITWIIKGGYFETVRKYPTFSQTEWFKKEYPEYFKLTIPHWRPPGTILYRPAKFQHSIQVVPGMCAWSIVIMFRKKRLWGFWTKMGFIPWFNYSSTMKCD